MLTPEFTVRRIARLEPQVDAIVAERLDALEAAGRPADLMRHFAWPIPGMVSCALLGIPRDDRAELVRNFDTGRTANRRREQQMAAGRAYVSYMDRLARRIRRDPGEDLLGMLVREHGADITDEELAGLAASLMAAGLENVAGTLGLGILALLEHPEQLALLLDRPDLVDRAVEELIRYVTIVPTASPRTALSDLHLAGQDIRAGDVVACSMFAANRARPPGSPPDELDITREPTAHVAFGHGIHSCLGAALARMELRIACLALLRRCPGLRLAVAADELRFRSQAPVYGVETLPVTW
jgi:cytochrome P450